MTVLGPVEYLTSVCADSHRCAECSSENCSNASTPAENSASERVHHTSWIMQALNERLNTNYVPTSEESCSLEEELNSSSQKIARIQIKVNDLDNRLDDLTRQKDALEAKTAAYRGMFSPARRLVPDVLQEIFIRCLPTTTNPVMSTLEPPLVLGRVCSQWRCIAYGTPALWSAIHVAVPADSPFNRTCSNAVRAEAIMGWLSRAGTIPLSISLCAPRDNRWRSEISWRSGSKARDSTVELLLDTIGPFLVQCKSIHISVFNPMWDSVLRKYFKGDFPFLYHLSFDAGSTDWADEIVYTSLKRISVDNVPKLRMISLANYGLKVSTLPFPWRQLTILNLCQESLLYGWDPARAFRTPDALLFLSWCPSLVFFGISLTHADSAYPSDPLNSTMVTLPDLIGLSIECDIDPKLFFACLNAPSLQYLQYNHELPWSGEGMDGEDRALHVSLRPFIQRVIQGIEELEIVTTHLTQTDIIRSLELFPELKRLSITSIGDIFDPPILHAWNSDINQTSFSKTILDRFMRRLDLSDKITSECFEEEGFDHLEGFDLSTDNAPCLCPRLERLRIRGASFPDSMVLDLIRFRVLLYPIYGVSRIHWLEILFPIGREGDPKVLDKVKEMQDQSGTFINVTYGGSNFSGHKRYSPYNGIASVDSDGVSTYTYNPLFGPALSVD